LDRQTSWAIFDKFKRRLVIKNEVKRRLLKSLTNSKNLPLTYRQYAYYQKSLLIRFSSLTQSRNRCVVSGRKWNVLSKVKYSRFVLRSEASQGNVPGFQRSSF